MDKRKDRIKTFRRSTIIQAAAELFRTKSYEHCSMEEVAAASHLARASLYRFFPSKDILREAIEQDACQSLTSKFKAIRANTELSPQEKVALSLKYLIFADFNLSSPGKEKMRSESVQNSEEKPEVETKIHTAEDALLEFAAIFDEAKPTISTSEDEVRILFVCLLGFQERAHYTLHHCKVQEETLDIKKLCSQAEHLFTLSVTRSPQGSASNLTSAHPI